MPALQPIGHVSSPLTDRAEAPKQSDEGAPAAWLVFEAEFEEGLRELTVGEEILLFTWLDRAERATLRVHPRDDIRAPQRGVFSTRSQDRPNPIGLHRVTIVEIASPTRFKVRDLEAFDGTPILDVKPVLRSRFATHLMFAGDASAAIELYAATFSAFRVDHLERYGPNEVGAEGSVKRADASLGEHALIIIDSPVQHAFTFTPAISLYVEYHSRAQLDAAFAALSAGGQVFMPLDDYGFSSRFGWCSDCFGVSWQLNLA